MFAHHFQLVVFKLQFKVIFFWYLRTYFCTSVLELSYTFSIHSNYQNESQTHFASLLVVMWVNHVDLCLWIFLQFVFLFFSSLTQGFVHFVIFLKLSSFLEYIRDLSIMTLQNKKLDSSQPDKHTCWWLLEISNVCFTPLLSVSLSLFVITTELFNILP